MPLLLAMTDTPNPPPPSSQGWLAGLGAAWMMFGSVAAGIVIGYGLDRWLGTAPWALTICALLFLAGGVYQVIREGSR